MDTNESELSPWRVFGVFRRRAPLVLVCVVVAVGLSVAYSLAASKRYTATASLLFNNTSLSQQVAGLQAVAQGNQQSQQDTNAQLLKLGDLAQRTAGLVGHGLTKKAVAGSVSISPQGDTTVVDVASTSSSPVLAAKVANTYANVFVSEQASGDRQYYQSALATVERQIAKLSPAQAAGAQGLALQNRAQSLATLAQLRTDTVSLAQAATVPSSPSSPKVRRNVIVAFLLGLLLGIVVALGVERMDQHLREPEELESIYGLPLLGAVPDNSALRRSARARSGSLPMAVTDAFQSVRMRLRYFNVDRDLRLLAVVSAQPGDGKTTVAHWLASAAAGMDSRTLLIETDLRRPTLAEEVGVASGPGLADVLIGARSMEDVVQSAKLAAAGSVDGERSLDVIVGGALPPNPAEMLESHAMTELLAAAKARYDFVVLDTSPLGAVSDALPLVSEVDGVVIVAGLGRTRRDSSRRLAATLRSVNAPLLGVIANRVKSRTGGYGYGYGYGDSEAARLASQQNHPTAQTNGHPPAEIAQPDTTAHANRTRGSESPGRAATVDLPQPVALKDPAMSQPSKPDPEPSPGASPSTAVADTPSQQVAHSHHPVEAPKRSTPPWRKRTDQWVAKLPDNKLKRTFLTGRDGSPRNPTE